MSRISDDLLVRLHFHGRGIAPPPFVALVDTREQLPYERDWLNVDTIAACLDTGDYSFAGARGRFAIERKSAADFAGSVTTGRDRFFREVERLAVLDGAAIVVESTPDRISYDLRHGRPNIASILASAMAIVADHRVPIWWAGNRQRGAEATLWILRRWHARTLAETARAAA